MSNDSSVIGHELNSHKLLPLLPALDCVTGTVAVLCTIFHFILGSQELELSETVTNKPFSRLGTLELHLLGDCLPLRLLGSVLCFVDTMPAAPWSASAVLLPVIP